MGSLWLLVCGKWYVLGCRHEARPDVDEILTGAAHSRILQRLKLNSKVALITGGRHCQTFHGMFVKSRATTVCNVPLLR